MRASLMLPIDPGARLTSAKGVSAAEKPTAAPAPVTDGEGFSTVMAEVSHPDAEPDALVPGPPVFSSPKKKVVKIQPTPATQLMEKKKAQANEAPVRLAEAIPPSPAPETKPPLVLAPPQLPQETIEPQPPKTGTALASPTPQSLSEPLIAVTAQTIVAATKPTPAPATPRVVSRTEKVTSKSQVRPQPDCAPPIVTTAPVIAFVPTHVEADKAVREAHSRPESPAKLPATAPREVVTPNTPRPVVAAAVAVATETAKVAFEARLRPQLDEPLPAPAPIAPQIQALEIQPSQTTVPGHTQPVAAPSGKRHDDSHEPPERQAKADTTGQPAHPKAEFTPADSAPSVEPKANAAPPTASAAVNVAVPSANPAATSNAAPPKSAPTTPGEPTPPAEPQPAQASAPAGIKIALNNNGQRVELRVAERAGDIHVTVRTPNDRLASALREDLPSLSAKLERSGFQSEIWRPSAPASGESKTIETSSGNAASDSHEQPGGRQQQDNPQQNPKNTQQAPNRKSDRKEFAWLLQSIR